MKMKFQKAGALESSEELAWLQNIGENHLAEWLKAEPADATVLIEDAVERMDKEWYSGDAEYEATKNKFKIQFGRLVEYFRSSGLVPESWYERYTLNMGKVSITDHIDLTARDKDGKKHRIKFDLYHAPKHTLRAKSDRNHPKSALEICIPACALGPDSVYEVWYLKGKKDKAGVYPAYEVSPNTNIISFCYEGLDLRTSLAEAIKNSREDCTAEVCENCRVKGVCRGYSATPTGDAAGMVKPEAAEPVLTPEQEQVVNWRDGKLAAIAVPGAGKTMVLIKRALKLVESGVNPGNILFLSHTRKAVEEITERVADALGISRDDKDMPGIMTLNGFGYNILRDNEKVLGHTLKLASDGERKELLEKVLNDPVVTKISGVNYASMKGQFGLLENADRWIRFYKEHGPELFSLRYPRVDMNGVAFVSAALDRMFDTYGYIRFDEQINLVVELFTGHPELAEKYSKVYRYIMIDEYQDVNDAQDEMIRRLAVHGNLVCVGDDDQAIFEFRGGTNEHMLRFAEENTTVVMTDNFRTNDGIASLSNIIILKNKKRIPKSIRASRKAKNKPALLRNPDDDELANIIGGLAKSYGPGGVAVIARDNKTLNELEAKLDRKNIPHSASKDYLTDSKVFSLLRDVLRIHKNGPNEASESFARLYSSVCGFPDCEAMFAESFHDNLLRNGLILDCADTVQNSKAWLKSELPSADFGRKLMESYRVINYAESAQQAIKDLFDVWFDGTANELSVLKTLLDMFEEGRVLTAERALGLMNTLVKYGDKTRVDYDYGSGFCRLLTAHDAKGKEFPAVVVLNIDEFIKGGTEEDVRVLYVAATRAKHTLVLTTGGTELESEIVNQIEPAVLKVGKVAI